MVRVLIGSFVADALVLGTMGVVFSGALIGCFMVSGGLTLPLADLFGLPLGLWSSARMNSRRKATKPAPVMDEVEEHASNSHQASAPRSVSPQEMALINHEMRSPLHVIMGSCGLMKDREDLPPELLGDVEAIQMASTMLLAQVNNLLELARTEARTIRVRSEWVDVGEIIYDVQQVFEPLVRLKGNQFRVNIPRSIGQFESDPQELKQILINLLVNANKYTENGEIRLGVWREVGSDGSFMCFSVRDQGVGIAPERLEYIFEPFRQANEGKGLEASGMGLGLSICKTFCQALGGGISVESTPGQGSHFLARVRC